MLAELGQISIIIALIFALLQSTIPLLGVMRHKPIWMFASVNFARGQFIFLLLALFLLGYLFYLNDFSVLYIAQNSNSLLPVQYRISAVWGGHEGSLLLWIFMLSLWTVAVTQFARHIPITMRAQIISVLGLVSVGFLLFMILTSNPFDRLLPAAGEGRDLNPLLQDPGLIFHPPMLYMGYVGFSVSFAFAIAALLSGRMDSAWTRWARPWALLAWAFLTVGILMGSWWAYYELGWGGWWFWDPVENASFMPWLLGTALLHSLAVTEARGIFKPWTVLLAILTFSLCLLGAFLVRSGVLTSVHAFATDPKRGLFILILLFITVAGSLILYAWRAPRLVGTGQFTLVSRESGILLNNILMGAAALCVLLGTLYPLILDGLNAGKISVGPPYFNKVFVPLAGASALFAAIGGISKWKKDSFSRIVSKLWLALIAAVLCAALLPLIFYDSYSIGALFGLMLAFWVFFSSLKAAIDRWLSPARINAGFFGMIVAHIGVAVFITGITIVTAYGWQKDVALIKGKSIQYKSVEFVLLSLSQHQIENYNALIGHVRVSRNGEEIALLKPEKRRYIAQPDNAMTEAGIQAAWYGDWYISLGEPLDSGGWSARMQYKPFVRFIWGGALLMALGGLFAAADRRYRRRRIT